VLIEAVSSDLKERSGRFRSRSDPCRAIAGRIVDPTAKNAFNNAYTCPLKDTVYAHTGNTNACLAFGTAHSGGRADFIVDSSQSFDHARAQVRDILQAVTKMRERAGDS
jgi:hypothetical protein